MSSPIVLLRVFEPDFLFKVHPKFILQGMLLPGSLIYLSGDSSRCCQQRVVVGLTGPALQERRGETEPGLETAKEARVLPNSAASQIHRR